MSSKRKVRVYDAEEKMKRRFLNMMARCYSKSYEYRDSYADIEVCSSWFDYENFKSWVLSRSDYHPDLTLDRIDPYGDYEPSNCRFVTVWDNNRNRKVKVYVEAWGERKRFFEWLVDPRCRCPDQDMINKRLKAGWTGEEAISLAPKEARKESCRLVLAFDELKTISHWAEDPRCVIAKKNLYLRLNRYWPIEAAISLANGSRKPVRKRLTSKTLSEVMSFHLSHG